MLPRKSGRAGEHHSHKRNQRIHLGCNSRTMARFSYRNIAIYTSTTDIPTSLHSSSSSTQHHHLTPPSTLWNVPRVGLPPNPVPCSQAVTLSQESSKSHHLQIPPLQHHFSSAPGRRERCQNQSSCGCEHRKGSCSLSPHPHLLWHTQELPIPGSAVDIPGFSSTAP